MIRKSSRRIVTRLACGRATDFPARDYAGPRQSNANGRALAAGHSKSPEMMVGCGFRGWIAGYQSGDIGRWEEVWRLYADKLGTRRAEVAVGSLAEWARSVAVASRNPISVLPVGSKGFCRDESLAISMIAACQHNTCPAMRACAFALMETSLVDEVLHHAGTFALTLRSLDAVVPPGWIVNANAYLLDPQASAAAH